MNKYTLLLAGAAFVLLPAHLNAQITPAADPAVQQPEDAVDPLSEDEDEAEAIVVTGQRRGGVIGDIPPEDTLTQADVRATGATSINELLEALAPQIGSARGRGGERPVLLLNGQRISGFRELRDIPTEAIERVDILPEEVALKYGYRADQRVVNFVLRSRFRSTAALARTQIPTAGGNASGTVDATRLIVRDGTRTQLNVHAEGNSMLTEGERQIARDDDGTDRDSAPARSLVGSRSLLRSSATVNRTILGNVGATLNGEVEHNRGRSLFGLPDIGLDPLSRRTNSTSGHLGSALNWDMADWRLSSTANADIERSTTRSDRRDGGEIDRANSTRTSADADITARGDLFAVPAGSVGLTAKAAATTVRLRSRREDADDVSTTSLGRTTALGSLSLDLPVSRRGRDFAALGNLTLNANVEAERLSDFGTLTTIGAGANWSPVERLTLLGSWTREGGAPAIQQLGNPVLTTPGTRVFDFTSGDTVLVTATSGGNPELDSDRRNVTKIGANWKPLAETDLRLRAEYVRSRLDRPVSSFPGVSAALEAAFPDRFVRDGAGELVSVDFRPVNYDRAKRDTLRIGFDFSKPLRSARPSQAQIDALRARARAGRPAQAPGGEQPQPGATPPEGEGRRAGGGGPGGGGGRFVGGGGGRNGGRLTFSVTDTITLVDEVTIGAGLPKLDYLNGDAFGQSGGRPRHQVEAEAGYSNNGLGARLSSNYRSGTRVTDQGGESLRFSPLATFDLRLFANLGQRFDLVTKHPWLRGSSVRLEVNNIFDSKPEVRNGAGQVPFSYQPDLLEPLGRTISISFRKLFLPAPGSFRRAGANPGR